jgi:hypothetical protein
MSKTRAWCCYQSTLLTAADRTGKFARFLFIVQIESEARRIQFLLGRDGYEATHAWIERTLGIYRAALAQPASMACDPANRRRFESAVRDFEEWLSAHPHSNS